MPEVLNDGDNNYHLHAGVVIAPPRYVGGVADASGKNDAAPSYVERADSIQDTLILLRSQLRGCLERGKVIAPFSIFLPNRGKVDFSTAQNQEDLENAVISAFETGEIRRGKAIFVLRDWPEIRAKIAAEGIPLDALTSPRALQVYAVSFCENCAAHQPEAPYVEFPLYAVLRSIATSDMQLPRRTIDMVFLPFITGSTSLYDEELILACMQKCHGFENWSIDFTARASHEHKSVLIALSACDNYVVASHAEEALRRILPGLVSADPRRPR